MLVWGPFRLAHNPMGQNVLVVSELGIFITFYIRYEKKFLSISMNSFQPREGSLDPKLRIST